jgi:hypothetical protein
VYHQLLGQDFHLLDDDAFTAPLTRYNGYSARIGTLRPPKAVAVAFRHRVRASIQYIPIAQISTEPGTKINVQSTTTLMSPCG